MGLRKRISIILALLVLTAGGFIFYFRYPQIWGSVVYPLKFEDLILKYSEINNLPPSLVCAFIYSESHFNENATSPVGATGLMQIMPRTGARLAKTLNEPNFTTSRLYEPEISIKFGTHYIRELIDRHQGDMTKAFMAYNGGEGAVINYERRAPIPRETSNYVRKIKGMWETYEIVYGSRWKETQVQKDNQNAQMEQISKEIKEAEEQGLILKAQQGELPWYKRIWYFVIYGLNSD